MSCENSRYPSPASPDLKPNITALRALTQKRLGSYRMLCLSRVEDVCENLMYTNVAASERFVLLKWSKTSVDFAPRQHPAMGPSLSASTL